METKKRSFRISKKNILMFFAIMGPGIITANVDNDAGGITTYSVVGASYGLKMLWILFIITLSLIITQEMCARMGVITGKGLSDLIRENFGLKVTIWAMLVLLVANLASTVAEFAGIAASMEIFGIYKYISVPIAAIFIWLLVVKGTYRSVEKIFLAACLVYLTYVVSAFMVKPQWGEVIKQTFTPSFEFSPGYINLFIATIGTTITPWMQFYLQSSVRDKGILAKDYVYEKIDVIGGAIFTDLIAFFIIVACAATIYKTGIKIETAKEAAEALRPFAGNYAEKLFAFGLFNASVFGAVILPLSTAYAITEAFGWESGVDKTFREAPMFIGIYTALIILSTVMVLAPNAPLISIMVISQTLNGILLPFILILMLSLVNNKRIMGEHTNSFIFNVIAWITVVTIIILTILLLLSPFIF
ncbi:MAG: Nramp family divalent metal transporter [Actinobacteria bacterium]|nr:Nramp family divalent metal transporter [Actinomycetota bacterium]